MDHSLSDNTGTPDPPSHANPGPPPKRAASSGESGDGPRTKRGKYTSAACDICKRRKLKCVPGEDGGSCQRCTASGLQCVFALPPPTSLAAKEKPEGNDQLRSLANELSQLRSQVLDLTGSVRELRESSHRRGSVGSPAVTALSPSARSSHAPIQPQFVGPTRSAFGLQVGERSLIRMGISVRDAAAAPSGIPSRTQSPTQTAERPVTDAEFWQKCTVEEVVRLFDIFQEEVGSVYPCVDTADLAARAPDVLHHLRNGGEAPRATRGADALDEKDIFISRIAVATAIVIEGHGKSDVTDMIVEPVERDVATVSTPNADLKEVQAIAILVSAFFPLSIYYFMCDQDLLAWRTIGVAGRMCLEMGLHHRKSLLDHFREPDSLKLATRVFWCVYVLDRRWSFGTSLSFSLIDRDIDPELPEPGPNSPYLQCMIGYGRLCSKLWDAIPLFSSATQTIPRDIAASLDMQTQDWLESIPSDLRLRHPRLGLAPRSQPRALHRLRALLYLRGNHLRILIHRYHLLSRSSIEADIRTAWLVVDIAQDSLQVLVHLNSTTDIYSRQQTAFNYFLLSALAVVFLAVCHAPKVFTEPCRRSFYDAVELIRFFSRNSNASRRLWHSVRGLLPALRNLGMHEEGSKGDDTGLATPTATLEGGYSTNRASSVEYGQSMVSTRGQVDDVGPPGELDDIDANTDPNSSSIPDMFQMSNELITLFDVFGQGQPLPGEFTADPYWNSDPHAFMGDGGEISRRFQWLV
ncbi:putative fungal-specific transcription factor [Thozetella sp. PMI_491]|nr:putative fungal-specific transcription factor [Thozetella sp. PMI_491]